MLHKIYRVLHCSAVYIVCVMCEKHVQWNLRTRDTLGLIVLSLVERSFLSRRYNNTLKY